MSECVLGHEQRREAEVGFLCLWHRNGLTIATTEITRLWYDLALIVEAGTAPKDETPKTKHLKAAEAPAPANLDVLALRDPRSHVAAIPPTVENYGYGDPSSPIPPVLTVVAGWVLCLAEERPLSASLPRSVIAQLDLLALHHDWIAAQPWVDDYSNEMRDLRDALKLTVRDHTHRKIDGRCQLPTETGVCGGVLLSENGSGVIRCTACRANWVTPQQQALLAITLEGKR